MCSFDAMSERRIHAFTHVTAINWSYSSEQFISAMLSKVRASKKKSFARGTRHTPSQSSIITALLLQTSRMEKNSCRRDHLVLQHSLTCGCHVRREDNAYRRVAACDRRIWAAARRTCGLCRPGNLDGSPHTCDCLSVVAVVWYL
jgi:hypothetical protein